MYLVERGTISFASGVNSGRLAGRGTTGWAFFNGQLKMESGKLFKEYLYWCKKLHPTTI